MPNPEPCSKSKILCPKPSTKILSKSKNFQINPIKFPKAVGNMSKKFRQSSNLSNNSETWRLIYPKTQPGIWFQESKPDWKSISLTMLKDLDSQIKCAQNFTSKYKSISKQHLRHPQISNEFMKYCSLWLVMLSPSVSMPLAVEPCF